MKLINPEGVLCSLLKDGLGSEWFLNQGQSRVGRSGVWQTTKGLGYNSKGYKGGSRHGTWSYELGDLLSLSSLDMCC